MLVGGEVGTCDDNEEGEEEEAAATAAGVGEVATSGAAGRSESGAAAAMDAMPATLLVSVLEPFTFRRALKRATARWYAASRSA